MYGRLALLLGVLLLILAACGDGDDNGNGDPAPNGDDTEIMTTDDATDDEDATDDAEATDDEDAVEEDEDATDDTDATDDAVTDDEDAVDGEDAIDDAEVTDDIEAVDDADDADATTAEISGDLTIFAAASLTDAFGNIGDELEDQNSDLSISFNFASSSALRTQLEEGAEADVFASANITQMDLAEEAERIDSDSVIFANNRLVLIVPEDNPAGIEDVADLAEPGILLVLAEEQVPVGEYSLAALDLMSQSDEYDDDFREQVLENLVSEASNVRAVATTVQLGEADAGIVYSSDVTPDISDDVLVIEIPDEYNELADYPAAMVEGAPNPDAAQVFLDYLMSADGQAILDEWGFIPVE